jgi:hypothetical protein
MAPTTSAMLDPISFFSQYNTYNCNTVLSSSLLPHSAPSQPERTGLTILPDSLPARVTSTRCHDRPYRSRRLWGPIRDHGARTHMYGPWPPLIHPHAWCACVCVCVCVCVFAVCVSRTLAPPTHLFPRVYSDGYDHPACSTHLPMPWIISVTRGTHSTNMTCTARDGWVGTCEVVCVSCASHFEVRPSARERGLKTQHANNSLPFNLNPCIPAAVASTLPY